MARPSPYPAELRERAVRMVAEIRPNYPTEWAAMKAVAAKLGIGAAETVRTWVRKAQVDAGHRPGVPSEEVAEIKRLKAENAELRRANEILRAASGFLRGRARPAVEALVAFIDEHRQVFGVEPICRILTSHGLKIATSTYYAARKRAPSARSVRDAELKTQISRVHADNFSVYGVRKVWRQLHREGIPVARCTVARLMRDLGLQGVRRGRGIRTTVRDDGHDRADDLLERDFTALRPNERWVADFTYVATWSGIVYVAFVVDVFSRAIVGWSAATSKRAKLVLDALDMALWRRDRAGNPAGPGLIHHSDAGSQYTSFAFTAHLLEAGIDASIGTVGDALDNALMESQIGLYKTELIKPRKPWHGLPDVELATAEWVDWFNNQRLHTAIGSIPPHEHETNYYAQYQPQPAAGANA
ncbi:MULTISPECIES: IS3 family transposase [Streptomyces]|uniref:IS3 family transposase n=2 Tax=Streptomyces TaxID=1883 RepID=A0A385D683_9ACTN|nr:MULTISPECIES: IS3 family transposase [Streptomyces]WTC02471.1 IS3 family transposase [Streptomyces albidoflavus]AXQ53222.1 IS3 family transposase [Streptomyces koyangensis]AXQ53237.1 IS3 family transposase [Streptomyces koyangensis]MBV1957222.1 IS3 family transposase [Streptomyces sp. BV333]MBV1957431.1 IS3 family transposase [Streptomyces sp. BV333]